MEDQQAQFKKIEEDFRDLQATVTAHEMVIACLLKYIEMKHGQSDVLEIRKGLQGVIDQLTSNSAKPDDVEINKILSEKVRRFL